MPFSGTELSLCCQDTGQFSVEQKTLRCGAADGPARLPPGKAHPACRSQPGPDSLSKLGNSPTKSVPPLQLMSLTSKVRPSFSASAANQGPEKVEWDPSLGQTQETGRRAVSAVLHPSTPPCSEGPLAPLLAAHSPTSGPCTHLGRSPSLS